MKNFNVLMIFILAILITVGCKSSKKDECNSAGSCTGKSTGSAPVAKTLSIVMDNSRFYDTNTQSWREFTAGQVSLGDLGTIPIYSDTMSIPLESAMDFVKNAETHYVLGSGVPEEDRNKIPFIRIRVVKNSSDPNPVYNIEYKRFDSNNNIQAQVKSNARIIGNYAYIPFVNDMFDGQMYISSLSSSTISSYTHQISISATASNANPSPVRVVKFKLGVQVPMKGLRASFSDNANDFNLVNRWNHYFNGTDYIANTNWKFASLVDDQERPDSIPLDVRFVFKTSPVLRMKQKIFVEDIFDRELYSTTGVKFFRTRGTRYMVKTINLDSTSHFRAKYSINDTPVTLAGGTTAELRNVPAGERWGFDFVYDFTRNAVFDSSKQLLTPLKPQCNIATRTLYYPLLDKTTKDTVTADGGFYASCHPNTNGVLSLTSSQLSSNTQVLKDTFFDFFGYRQSQVITDTPTLYDYDVGNFYGLSEVEFSVSGCVKVFTREASALVTNPNAWEQKSIPTDDCGTGDFTRFEVIKSDTIGNHIGNYLINADISQVMTGLGSGEIIEPSNWSFNGSEFSTVVY